MSESPAGTDPGPVHAAAQQLLTALRTVDGMRVYDDLGANLDPPAVVLGPPALGWRSFCGPHPTSARFVVFVVVKKNEWAQQTLWQLVPLVAAAVEENVTAAAVQDGPSAALPTMFPSGGSELPAYELTIEVDL